MGRTFALQRLLERDANFNSLAPCGANLSHISLSLILRSFQLTRPVWGEPPSTAGSSAATSISTHSPRVGRTPPPPPIISTTTHFNSLAPCGANHARGGTRYREIIISTHSPRVGRTLRQIIRRKRNRDFNSLAPCGANPIYII